MMGNKSCSWVLRRLPLLDGGELAVDERRHVERHLIGCPDCRGAHASTADALGALRVLAAAPARTDAPPLWPALHRQIRQSRHVSARPAWSWSWLFARTSPALGFGLMAGGVMAVGFALGRTAPTPAPAPTRLSNPASPARGLVGPPAWTAGGAVRSPGAVATTPPRPTNLADRQDDPFRAPSIRLDYALDHGHPIGSGARDPQRSY